MFLHLKNPVWCQSIAFVLRAQLYSMKPPFVCFAAGGWNGKGKNTIRKMLAMHTMSRITPASVWLHMSCISCRGSNICKKLELT